MQRGVGVSRDVFDRSEPTSPIVLGAVALGGAVGAIGRWAVAEAMGAFADGHHAGSWGWATLIVNVVGSFLIGLAARRLDRDRTSWAFCVTGVLGGFTTFSALALEVNDLADADRLPLALAYGAVTLVAGVAAAALALGPGGEGPVPSRDPSPGSSSGSPPGTSPSPSPGPSPSPATDPDGIAP